MSKPFLTGSIASLCLLALYFLAMTLLSSWDSAVEQFRNLWFFMVPLSTGFGIQVGLYTRIKQSIRAKTNASLATSGTSAGAAMLACCAHHATDVLPFLGLSGAAIFVSRYQAPILVVSLLINIYGINVMTQHIKKVTA